MRTINEHKVNPANDLLEITVLDDPGPGGANHSYQITGAKIHGNPSYPGQPIDNSVMTILFQNGAINESGVNGLTQEVCWLS